MKKIVNSELVDVPQSEIDEMEVSQEKAEEYEKKYGYIVKRSDNYPSIGDQLDMQYHDQLDGTTTWKDAVAKVKEDNPKE